MIKETSDEGYEAGYEAYYDGDSISSYQYREDYSDSLHPSYWAQAFKKGWKDAKREDESEINAY